MRYERPVTQETNRSGGAQVHHSTPHSGYLSTLPGELSQPATSILTDSQPVVASCRSGDSLARSVADKLKNLGKETHYLPCIDFSFSDAETGVRLPAKVRGAQVFLFQSLYDPTSPRPVDQNYMAFLLAIRALKEWGASSVTGVVPYLAYARQNRASQGLREPVSAGLMADLSATAGLDSLITFRSHTEGMAAFYKNVAFEQSNSVSFFASVFANFYSLPDVILVAPDAGAVPFVTAVGQALNLKCAVGSKYRPQAEECILSEIIGDFSEISTALVLDDIVSSGGTIYKLIRCLWEEKGIKQIYLGAAHNLCLAAARERLLELNAQFGLKTATFTNSIPQTTAFTALPFVEVLDLSDLLARQIWDRLTHCESAFALE